MAVLQSYGKKEIHHLIKPYKDGNERIQCIEFKDNNQRSLLIVSVYLPTKGCHDLDEYIDSIDQLFEIYQKYNLTHDIIIGGDINEDLTKKSNDYRTNYIKQKKKLGKLQVWNNDISNAYKEMKQTNIKWCNAGKPNGNPGGRVPSLKLEKI